MDEREAAALEGLGDLGGVGAGDDEGVGDGWGGCDLVDDMGDDGLAGEREEELLLTHALGTTGGQDDCANHGSTPESEMQDSPQRRGGRGEEKDG